MPKRPAIGIELLADPTRRRIVGLIASNVRHPNDIADALGLSRPATSRQLRLLVAARLLRWDRSLIDRRFRIFTINPVMQASITAWLAGVDLRHARSVFAPSWSPPARQHGLRRLTAVVAFERDDFS